MKSWLKKLFCKHDLVKRPLGMSKHGMAYSVRCSKCNYYHIEIGPDKPKTERETLVECVQSISEHCKEHFECEGCQIDDLCKSFRTKMPDQWIKRPNSGCGGGLSNR